MAEADNLTPTQQGVDYVPYILVANNANSGTNSIPPLQKTAVVTGVVNDANDWVVLPPLNSCPIGHEITLLCSAAANFELRTPTSSGEKINAQDCDGTKEYLCTDTEVVKVVKISDSVGWMAHGYTAIGAVAAAVVPD
jgi:hypothetical protein